MTPTPTPDDNYARRTNDYIGSLGRIPNEPKREIIFLSMISQGFFVKTGKVSEKSGKFVSPKRWDQGFFYT